MSGRRSPSLRTLLGSLRPRSRSVLRGLAALSAFMLLVSGLSLSALTAGIEIAPTAIGRPEFAGNEAFGLDRRAPIPRAAFGALPAFARGPAAFGGDRIYDIDVDGTSYRVHEFTTVGSATFTVTRPITVEYLVLGGGGGGGAWVGGGGGGGGALTGAITLNGGVPVTVGGGGLGAIYLTNSAPGQRQATSGASSSLGASITAAGGGHGGSWDWQAPGSAGTGGGAGRSAVSTVSPAGQGFAGGAARGVADNGYPTGGGGGAGGRGQDWSTAKAGDGGIGLASAITGIEVRYGGGGGGGIHGHNVGTNAAPGSGRDGGGDGAARNTAQLPSQNGKDGRGGGGGGGGNDSNVQSFGGNGGSGIVIVRYEIPRTTWAPVATGGTVTEFIGDGTGGTIEGLRYRVHTFTGNSTFLVPEGSTIPEVDVLLVGGGGGGGTRHGGGGGGGGVLEVLGHPLGATGSFAVQVGTGGAGMTTSSNGANGGDSTALGLTAVGGGRGAGTRHGAGSGGSGGGSNVTAAGAAASPGATGQGNAGGAGRTGPNEGDFGGGGGGGAGQPGSPATAGGAAQSASGGRGGDGRVSTMTGSPVVYGGGGGGSISHLSTGVVGLGGLGGGGNAGALGWELYDASGVGRRLSWRVWQHNLAHPSNATGFEAFFGGTPHSTGSAPMIAADQSATGNTPGTVNVVNWLSAANLTSLDGVSLPRDDNFAFEVTGWFVPRETGTYHFTLESDDAADLRIGATTVAAFYGGRGTPNLGTTVGSIVLAAGQAYAFRARMEEGTGGEGLRVFWQTPSQRTASATTWWQNADELVGNRPSGSPLSAAELGRFVTLSARFATQRGVATVVTQTHGATTTPNTLNWSHPSSGSSTELPLPSVIGVGGLADDFMATVAGTFVPKESGTYTFALSGDDAVDLAVGGTTVVSHYGQKAAPAVGSRTGTVNLQAGVPVRIVVRHHQRDGGAELRVFWRRPSQTSGWHQDAEELRSTGRDGVDGLGGGGGAGGFSGGPNAPGGRGGDGVVIIRYPLAREIGAIPSGVRDAVAGEAKDSAVLRWQVPAISPPAVSLAGYRIEHAPVGSGTWTEVTSGVTFTTTGSGAQTFVRAGLTGIPSGPRHRFRITPLGDVDGPSTVVTPVAKGGDTVTLVGDEVVHHYTTVGASTLQLAEDRDVRAMLVGGGGGGGGGAWAGGGGAGGVLQGQDVPLAAGTIPVVVGGGGAGGQNTGSPAALRSGGDGGASSLGSVVAPGGGGGGGAGWNIADYSGQGSPGGSGGGTGEHGSALERDGVLLYQTTDPRRDSDGGIVYVSGRGTAANDQWKTFTDAGTPITSVTYRMQVTVDGTSRFAEATFDPWPGLTAQDLRIPDLRDGNRFVVQRFVENMRVESNMTADVSTRSTGVTTGTGRTGYLEIWPWNYTATATGSGPAGSNDALYDFNDSHSGSSHYGSFQVHDVTTSGAERTVLAWNRHFSASNETPDIGLGSQTAWQAGTHPDWTFSQGNGLGTSGWRLDIRVNRNPWQSLAGGASTVVAPAGWTAHGHAGGANGVMASQAGAGGGGAGGAGGAVPESSRLPLNGVERPRVAGDGGPGITSSITGTPIVYAGGGGGGTRDDGGDICSVGGSGGGGAGRCLRTGGTGTAAIAGVDGLGGGGGGGQESAGAPGGSGTVIVRYALPAVRGGETVSEIVDGGVRYRVHRFDTPGAHTLEFLRDVDVEYLVVGGGASGTRGWCSILWGHGGGGGGVSTGTTTIGAGLVPVTVGAGGAGSTSVNCDVEHTGRAGGTSTFGTPQATVTSTGGSGANSRVATGGASGTGTIDGVPYGPRAGGGGSAGLGAGGGGGAGGAGAGINGGAGVLSSITGTEVSYGAGGPGRNDAGFGTPAPGTNGIGGGGSDGQGGGFTFAPGRDGIVIVRYRIP